MTYKDGEYQGRIIKNSPWNRLRKLLGVDIYKYNKKELDILGEYHYSYNTRFGSAKIHKNGDWQEFVYHTNRELEKYKHSITGKETKTLLIDMAMDKRLNDGNYYTPQSLLDIMEKEDGINTQAIIIEKL